MSVAIWQRLLSVWARALLPAVGLAILFAPVSFYLTLIPIEGSVDALIALPVSLTHGLFIALIADGVARRQTIPRDRAFLAGIALGAVIALFASLDLAASSYQCADGMVVGRSAIPMLPWTWIGWFLLALFAAPSRLLGYPPTRLVPWTDRVAMLFPFALLITYLGIPFQRHSIDCTPPFDGYGLVEGGLFLIPLLSLFLFSMAFSLAVLSAAFIRPKPEEKTG